MAHHHESYKNISVAFFLNLAFTVFEIIGGFLTNSMAILSDAVHDLGDSVTLALSWYLERLSRKPRTDRLTYGYKRFSLLAAVISAAILLTGSVFILSEAIPRLFHPEEVKVEGMILMAIIGVAVNGLAVLRLKGGEKINERVVMFHLLEDAIGWIAVLIVSLVMKMVYLPILDPILSVGLSVFIIAKIVPNIKEAVQIFLQYTPKDSDINLIKSKIESLKNVKEAHDMHLWSVDGLHHIFSCHLVLDDNISVEETRGIKEDVRKILREEGINHPTLEFELADEECRSCDS
ncbi:MAG TPA: cation transporter [Firmicutes bacterium]|nr:cation transporter [Bacillota bacterium]